MSRTNKPVLSALSISSLIVLSTPWVVSAATSSVNTTINASVASTISLVQDTNTLNLPLAPTSNPVETQTHVQLTTDTNNSSGYALTIIDGDTNTTLNQTTPAASIPATSGTAAAPVVLATNTWGYHLDSWAGSGTGADATNTAPTAVKFAGVPASSGAADTLVTTGAAGQGVVNVFFGANAGTNQTAGSGYTDTIAFTATTN